MKTIEQLYEPYNFSSTRCYVIKKTLIKEEYIKIEEKIPQQVQHLKGIYISVSCNMNIENLAGLISLNFNGQTFKTFHIPVYKTDGLTDFSKPYPVNEELRKNSFMQGYFMTRGLSNEEYPFTLSIYLHYKP